jgi:hypothetical protein
MATKKEPTVYTASELEAAQAEAFMDGMAAVHTAMFDAIDELKTSLENTQAILYLGNALGQRTDVVEQLQVAFDALVHLQDVLQDKYDLELNKHKRVLATQEYAELRESLGL